MKWILFMFAIAGDLYFPVGHGLYDSAALCVEAGEAGLVKVPVVPPGVRTQFVCAEFIPAREAVGT